MDSSTGSVNQSGYGVGSCGDHEHDLGTYGESTVCSRLIAGSPYTCSAAVTVVWVQLSAVSVDEIDCETHARDVPSMVRGTQVAGSATAAGADGPVVQSNTAAMHAPPKAPTRITTTPVIEGRPDRR